VLLGGVLLSGVLLVQVLLVWLLLGGVLLVRLLLVVCCRPLKKQASTLQVLVLPPCWWLWLVVPVYQLRLLEKRLLLLRKLLELGVLARWWLSISLVWMVLVRLHSSSNTRGARTTGGGRTGVVARVNACKFAVPQSTTWVLGNLSAAVISKCKIVTVLLEFWNPGLW
jgi:hypothetical protein